ncbi:MAG: AAA family ATPase [Candidatus Epulonipiscioides saccharophilum]|nr:MAG: AAA family ATPase [Epulopiscium sp. AS2M-Bin001]
MDLFDYVSKKNIDSPLALRLRPKNLNDIVGQEHILSEGKLLRRAIVADKLQSIIFYGPPGTGKTTIAKIIANATKANFETLNATTSGKTDLVKLIKDAKDRLATSRRKSILFIDEIHRFNKAQQDVLLPAVEDGTVILIGATTENPYFEVNRALLSRSLIFELYPLSKENIVAILQRAISDKEAGLGSYDAHLTEEAANFIATNSSGDARVALNAIELATLTTKRNANGKIEITDKVASECMQKRILNYDKKGDNHYDVISAFIKSMRGSDPNAALHYLARMLESGEDIKFIARRIIICASEDIGNADPIALIIATNAMMAVERVGMPESKIILSQAVTYIAMAPKSNACCVGIEEAISDIKNIDIDPVPDHLRDSHYSGAQELGRGIGYKYPHSYEGNYVQQQYLPNNLVGKKYYHISKNK